MMKITSVLTELLGFEVIDFTEENIISKDHLYDIIVRQGRERIRCSVYSNSSIDSVVEEIVFRFND